MSTLAWSLVLGGLLFLAIGVIPIAIKAVRRATSAWLAEHAAKRREAAAAKRHADMVKWGFLCYPREQRRIPNAAIDPAHRRGQFATPDRIRDVQGVTR